MTRWTRRVRRPLGPMELRQVRDAAEELAEQARNAPPRSRVVFQTVSEVAMIGTVLITGALAAVHLWRALVPRHPESRPTSAPETAGADGSPPRRHSRRFIPDDAH